MQRVRELMLLVTIVSLHGFARADDVATRVVGSGVLMSRTQNGWSRVCTSPCDVALTRGGIYKIAGDSLRESNPFAFSPSTDRVVMTIDAAHRAPWVAGLAIGILGTTIASTGVAFLALSRVGEGSTGFAATGGVMIGVGAISAIVAFAFAVANARSDVRLTVRP